MSENVPTVEQVAEALRVAAENMKAVPTRVTYQGYARAIQALYAPVVAENERLIEANTFVIRSMAGACRTNYEAMERERMEKERLQKALFHATAEANNARAGWLTEAEQLEAENESLRAQLAEALKQVATFAGDFRAALAGPDGGE